MRGYVGLLLGHFLVSRSILDAFVLNSSASKPVINGRLRVTGRGRGICVRKVCSYTHQLSQMIVIGPVFRRHKLCRDSSLDLLCFTENDYLPPF